MDRVGGGAEAARGDGSVQIQLQIAPATSDAERSVGATRSGASTSTAVTSIAGVRDAARERALIGPRRLSRDRDDDATAGAAGSALSAIRARNSAVSTTAAGAAVAAGREDLVARVG